MHSRIKNHFKKVDPIIHKLVDQFPLEPLTPSLPDKYFLALCREIVGQQLSNRAAKAIFNKFLLLFSKKRVTPNNILNMPDQQIRDAGLSWSKVGFLKDLSLKVKNKELNLKVLQDLEEEELIQTLTKVKGIGRWTAEMFLIFILVREDIFSHGDLGLKNAIKIIYKIENPTKEQIEKIVSKWSPYKSYGSRILWKTLDNE